MSEEFGGNFVTITDEEGNELDLEHLHTLEYNGQIYMAFFPAIEESQDASDASEEEETGLIILKVIEENGEEFLSTLDSDEELESIYDQFMASLFEDEGED